MARQHQVLYHKNRLNTHGFTRHLTCPDISTARKGAVMVDEQASIFWSPTTMTTGDLDPNSGTLVFATDAGSRKPMQPNSDFLDERNAPGRKVVSNVNFPHWDGTNNVMEIQTQATLRYWALANAKYVYQSTKNYEFAEELFLYPSHVYEFTNAQYLDEEVAYWVRRLQRTDMMGVGFTGVNQAMRTFVNHIQEMLRVVYYDSEAGNYICQKVSGAKRGGCAPSEAPDRAADNIALFILHESMVNVWDGKVGSNPNLKFGDYISISCERTAGMAANITDRRSVLRAIHAANGVYDVVINAHEFKEAGTVIRGHRIERDSDAHFRWSLDAKQTELNINAIMARDGQQGGMKGGVLISGNNAQIEGFYEVWEVTEVFALAVGANRLNATMTIATDSPIPENAEKPEWVSTPLDNRPPKKVDLRPTPVGGKSDIVRCQNCNGRVIIFTESSGEPGHARCPHCRAKEGVQFPQLLNAPATAEDTPDGQEDE